MPLDFEDTACRQIDGVALGVSLGPTISDVFLPMIELKLNDSIS